MKNIIVYTDGACSGNPGPGGWGAVLMFEERYKELSGYEEETTNNRMELHAAVKALEILKYPCHVKLHSDSAYLINAFNQNWIKNWQRNGWKNSKKEPVLNQDLWMELIELSKFHQVEWIKVKGHSDNKYNNRCDELARQAIEKSEVILMDERKK